MFNLHERLAADTIQIKDLSLCRALLMKDARYPWIILVPRQNDLKELHQLAEDDGIQLWKEIRATSKLMETAFHCDKVNVGALGNMVPQLHIHIIVRTIGDAAWPGPVWGVGNAESYTENHQETILNTLKIGFENVL